MNGKMWEKEREVEGTWKSETRERESRGMEPVRDFLEVHFGLGTLRKRLIERVIERERKKTIISLTEN